MKNVELKNAFKRSLSVLLTFVFLFSALNITALAGTLQGTGGTTQAPQSTPPEQTVYTLKFVHLDGTQTSEADEVITLTPTSPSITFAVRSTVDGVKLNDKTAQDYADASSNVYFDATAMMGFIPSPSFTLNYDAAVDAVDVYTYYDNKAATPASSFEVTYAYSVEAKNHPDYSTFLTLPTTTDVTMSADGKSGTHVAQAATEAAKSISYRTGLAGMDTYPVVDTATKTATNDVYYVHNTFIYKFYGWLAVPSTTNYTTSTLYTTYDKINELLNGTNKNVYKAGETLTITENTTLYPIFISQYSVYTNSKNPKHEIPDYNVDASIDAEDATLNNMTARFYMMHMPMSDFATMTEDDLKKLKFNPYIEDTVGLAGNDEALFADFNQSYGVLLKPGNGETNLYTYADPIEPDKATGELTQQAIWDADVIDKILVDPSLRPSDFDAITAYNEDRGLTSTSEGYLDPNLYGVFWYVAKVENDGYHIDGIIYQKSLIGTTVRVEFYDVDGTTQLFTETLPTMGNALPSIDYFKNFSDTTNYNAAAFAAKYGADRYTNYTYYSEFTRHLDETGYQWMGWYNAPQSDPNALETTVNILSGVGNGMTPDANGEIVLKLYAHVGMEVQYNTNYPANTLTDDTFVKTDSNGNTVTYAPGTQNVTSETLAATGFAQPTGHTFVGWNTKADGTGTAIAAGTGTFNLDPITGTGANIDLPDAPYMLYAQWSALYPVTYDENIDMDYNTLLNPADRSFDAGNKQINEIFDILPTSGTGETIDRFSNPGYTLVGWRYVSSTGAYTDYDINGNQLDGSGNLIVPNTNDFKMPGAQVVLQAIWQKNVFTATAPTIQRVYNSEAHSIDIATGAGFTATDSSGNPITINAGDITVKAGSTNSATTVGTHPVTFIIDLDNYVDDVEVTGNIQILERPVAISVEENSKTYNGLNGPDPAFDFIKNAAGDVVVTDELSTFTGTINGVDYATLPAEAKTLWPAGVDMTTHFSGAIKGGAIIREAETGNTPEQYVKRGANNVVEEYENVLTSLPTAANVTNINISLVSVKPANFTINPIDVAYTALDYAAVYNQTQESDVTSWMARGKNSSWMYEAVASGATNTILTEDIDTGILSAVTFDDTLFGALATLLSTAPAQGGEIYADVFDIKADTTHAAYGSYNFTELNGDLRVNTNGSINATPVDVTRVYNGVVHSGSVNVSGLPSGVSYTVEYRVVGSNSNSWTATPSATHVDESASYEFRVLATGYTTYYGTVQGTRNDTVDVNITPRSLTATAQAVSSTYGDQDVGGIGAPALTAPVVEDKTPDSANNTDTNYIAPATYNADIAAMAFTAQHTNVANEINARSYTDAITTSYTANPRGNYVVTEVNAAHTVNKAILTVTAANYEKDYLQTDAQAVAYNNGTNTATAASNGAFGYYVGTSQLKYSDTVDSVAINRKNPAIVDVNMVNGALAPYADELIVGLITGTIANTRTPNPETAALTDNYTISTVEGDLLINPLAITVEAGDYTRMYGEDDSTITATQATQAWTDLVTSAPFGYRVTGLPAGFNLTATVAMQNVASSYVNSGTYQNHLLPSVTSITSAAGDASGNFTVTEQAGDFIITPREVGITAGDYTKIFGYDDISAVSTSTMGMPANTTLTPATSGPFGYYVSSGSILASDMAALEVTVDRTDALVNVDVNQYLGTLVATAAFADPTTAGNYTFLQSVDGNFEITPRPITITAASFTKMDTDPDPVFTAAITRGQLVNAGDLGTISARRIAGFVGNPPGFNNDVLEPTYTQQNNNYIVTLRNGDLSINTLPPTPVPPTPVPPTPIPPTPVPPTPVPPTPPTPPTPDIPTIDIPDTEPPASATIEETELPLAPGSPAWALLNLILTLATAFISVVLLINYFGKKKEEEQKNNNENAQTTNENEQEKEEVKRKGILRLASLVPAIVAVIVFILTEDMTLPMTIVDEWTWLMALIAFAQVVVATSAKKQIKDNDEDDDEAYAN